MLLSSPSYVRIEKRIHVPNAVLLEDPRESVAERSMGNLGLHPAHHGQSARASEGRLGTRLPQRSGALEVLESEAVRRAVEGTPVVRKSYWKGEVVGEDTKIEYSDHLLAMLLRARAPERYGTKVDIQVPMVIKAIAGIDPREVL
jgi:hypothetical protein